MLTEAWEKYPDGAWGSYSTPLTQRHGTERFHSNAAGNPNLALGVKVGINVSAAFLDGHAASIDQEAAFNPIHWDIDGQ